MKTSELTGAQLDYWTARAEGIPAEQLTIRRVPRTDWLICAHSFYDVAGLGGLLVKRVDYCTNWQTGGPLIEKHTVCVGKGINQTYFPGWFAELGLQASYSNGIEMFGDNPLQAICRAVVHAAFGDEIEEVAVCQA